MDGHVASFADTGNISQLLYMVFFVKKPDFMCLHFRHFSGGSFVGSDSAALAGILVLLLYLTADVAPYPKVNYIVGMQVDSGAFFRADLKFYHRYPPLIGLFVRGFGCRWFRYYEFASCLYPVYFFSAAGASVAVVGDYDMVFSVNL